MFFRCLSVGFAALFFGLTFSDAAVAQMDFDFPKDSVPVLRVDEYYNEANKDKRPMLLVYPDGRVVRSVSDLKTEDYEFTLSKQKFKEFLNEVFVKNDFATISDVEIFEGLSPRRPVRASFRVTANMGGGSHVVSFGDSWLYDRLGLGGKRHLKAEHLQRFIKVETALRELGDLALIGGEDALQDTVKQASAKFKESYPDGPAISDADLFSVRLNSEGKVAVRFKVDKEVVDPYPVSVWVTKAKGEPELGLEVKVDSPINCAGGTLLIAPAKAEDKAVEK